MQTSSLLFCVLSVSFIAAAYGGQLIAVHPTGLEVDATDDSVTLQCTATNEGEISHWLLNGARLDPASLSGVDVTTTAGAGGSSTLSISSYQPAVHAGEYRCVARLLEGEMLMEVSHAAPVSHFTQRTFTTEPQDFPVYSLPPLPGAESATPSREAAAFNCEFSALPRFGRRPVIVWEYESASTGNATVLDLSGSTTMSSFQYDHIGYFQLHSPKEFDDGSRVRCLARHPDDPSQQVESQWATIVISNSSRPADFPVFTTQMPSQMHRIDGQQLVMGCSKSTPITSTNLQWVGEVPSEGVAFLTAGIQLIIVRNDVVAYGSSNVLIPDVSIDDVINQTFTCRAVLDLQVFEWTTTIIPPPPPLPPLMYNDQYSADTINYGATGIINLEARNYTGHVAWWVNGLPIPSSPKYTISSDMLTLTIHDIVLNDSGLYQAELLDLQPPQLVNFQISIRGDRAFVLPGADDPLTVDFGSLSVLFDCPTVGNVPPVTSYSWSFNGAQISHDGSKYIVHSNGSLAVNNIQLSDAGTYSCAPQNTLGNFNSTSVTLTVNGDRAFVLPGADEPITVDFGSPSVLFDCPTEGNVPPVTSYSWSFNGAQVSHDGSKYVLCPNGSLAVNNIQLSDAGTYSCAPQNALGNFNSSSATLTVNVPRTAPDVPSINHVGIVDETSIFVNWTALDDVDSYTLEIRTSHREKEGEREGEGEGDEDDDEQDVSKNGDSNEGESVKTLDLDTNKHIITDVDFELIYSFRVKATNDIGSSDYSSAYEFDPETALERGHGRERSGLRGWEVALIVIFIILLLLLCCILLLCICLCWRREKRTYYAAKKEKEMQDGGVESYRQTDEPDNKDN